ncbi:MAG: phosphoribosylaminoimidazolesuccinocarboxamide synthase, partial [Pseudomonadota bacterium]|nr:phosphoribosylaminoimidazolesuccinocarboxamide synthase [Pseudomonadota bacterium]
QARLESGEEPDSLDKEFLRLWVSERCDPYRDPIPPIPEITLIDFSQRYISLFETITGEKFLKPDEKLPIQQRIRQNLAAAFPDYFT